MLKTKKQSVAKSEKEWWEFMRTTLNHWNSNSMQEDNMSLLEYVGEYVGVEIFGYKVNISDYTESGYSLTKVDK